MDLVPCSSLSELRTDQETNYPHVVIYHEKQDRDGSMLCAQHCINNLLQQSLYSAADLADLAADLDRQENAELTENQQNRNSQNADATGFFSVGVLENALRVFDLELVRWRSEEMKPFHSKPESQAAYIMNLNKHWLPLRRFAASPNRWYNLNSLLNNPEILPVNLVGLAIETAENEGHSVFVVRRIGSSGQTDEGPSVLPECEADLMGLQFGDPSAQDPISSSRGGANVEFEQFQRQQRAVYEAQQNASLGQSFENRSTEGTYASAISQSAPMNRFQRTRMEEEEDLRKAIEASLNEAHEQGTSSVLPAGERGNETSPVISTQPAEPMPPILETMGLNKKGFVGGLVASIFEPGVNQPLYQAMNISFFLLILSLLFLGYMTNWSKHVLFLMLVSTGLWMTMIWFVQELAKVQHSQQNAPPSINDQVPTDISEGEEKKDK